MADLDTPPFADSVAGSASSGGSGESLKECGQRAGEEVVTAGVAGGPGKAINNDFDHEASVSTFEDSAKATVGIPCADGDPGWPRGHSPSSFGGASPADRGVTLGWYW